MSRNSAQSGLPLSIGGRWADLEQARFGALWFEYLHLSPSYELARKARAETLSEEDQLRLPGDFEAVLSVYDNLGDVGSTTFDDWWLDKGIRHFGFQGDRPSVQLIEELTVETKEPLPRLTANAQEYIEGRWTNEGRRPCVIVSIPKGLSQSQISNQIAQIMSATKEHQQQDINIATPTYQLLPVKKDLGSLYRYLECMWWRIGYLSAKLYEVGVLANLSTVYSPRIARDHFNGAEIGIDDRHALKILTSRALHRGTMIAENAARGLFPTYAKCPHAIRPDWAEENSRLQKRMERDEALENGGIFPRGLLTI